MMEDVNCDERAVPYFTKMYNEFAGEGIVTFVATGLRGCWPPYDPYRGIPDLHDWNGAALATYMEYVDGVLRSLTGNRAVRVDLVAHSMGGITSRAYSRWLARHGVAPRDRVARLFMIATPNAGRIGRVPSPGATFQTQRWLTLDAMKTWNSVFGVAERQFGIGYNYLLGTSSPRGLSPHNPRDSAPLDTWVPKQSVVDYPICYSSSANRKDLQNLGSGRPIGVRGDEYLCLDDTHSTILTEPNALTSLRSLLTGHAAVDDRFRCKDKDSYHDLPCPASKIGQDVVAPLEEATDRVASMTRGVLNAGESTTAIHMIDPTPSARLEMQWAVGDLRLALIDPAGRTIDPSTTDPGITYEETRETAQPSRASYTIDAPLPGSWQIEVANRDPADRPAAAYVVASTTQGAVSLTVGGVDDVGPVRRPVHDPGDAC